MHKERKFRGFTLIEMVVSVTIIAAITTLFIANYHSANKRSDLIMTAQKLVADLHAAQSNTLGLAKYNSLLPDGGWGVSFDIQANSYTIFADLDAVGSPTYQQYNEGEGNSNYGARLVELPESIRLDELKTAGNQTYSRADVTFLPPDPRTNIWVSGSTSTALEIKLVDVDDSSVKTVRINFLGLAEVID